MNAEEALNIIFEEAEAEEDCLALSTGGYIYTCIAADIPVDAIDTYARFTDYAACVNLVQQSIDNGYQFNARKGH